MQDNAQSETLADGNPVSMPSSSCIPQSTSLPQSSPSLCTGFSSSRFVADDFLFQQQCFAVGQENFSVRNQPELSNQRELLQNRISLNGETDEAFSSSINIVPHLDASNGSLSRVQTVFNGEQLPQLENVDLVANAQKPQKLGDYGVKRANKASTTARSSRGLRHTTRIRSKTVKPSQFRERQIRGIQTIDQVSLEISNILQISTYSLSLRLRRGCFWIQSQENCKGQLLSWAPNKELGQSQTLKPEPRPHIPERWERANGAGA